MKLANGTDQAKLAPARTTTAILMQMVMKRAMTTPVNNKKTNSTWQGGGNKKRPLAVCGRTKLKHPVESDITTGKDRKTIPAAMAWGSDRRSLVGGGVNGEEKVVGMSAEMISDMSISPNNVMAPSTVDNATEVCFLPDSVVYQPNSNCPLETVNLGIWQDQLSTVTVEDLLRRNSTFTSLILRRARRRSDMLALIARHFGRLVTDIDLSDSAVVDDAWLTTFGSECPAITRITATRCKAITDRGVNIIARKKGAVLQALNLAGCEYVSDNGVELLAKHCSNLRFIDLSGCPRVRDRSVFAISSLVGLQSIALDGCAEVSDEAIRHLFNSVTQLKSLSIKGCTSVTEEGLRFMHEMPVPWGTRKHRNCAQLETLRIGKNNYISDEFMKVLAVVCPHLRTLEVDTCPLIGGDEAMGKIGKLAELVDVTLETLPRVSDQGIRQFFCDLPRRALKKLSLAGCSKVTDISLKCIAKSAQGLRQLHLDRNVSVTDRGLGYLAKGLTALKLLQATHLGMVTDHGVRLLARKCLELSDIDFSHCLRLTGACFSALRKLHNLEVLCLSGCHGLFPGNADDTSSHRRDGRNTSVFHALDTKTTTTLDNAEFYRARCIELARQPNLTDAAVCSLVERNCRTLTSLDLSWCSSLTAGGIANALKFFSVLKRLDVTGCELITANDVECFTKHVTPALLLMCARLEVHGFDGLHCCATAEDTRSRREVIASAKKEVLGARAIQQAFRNFKERGNENEKAAEKQGQLTVAAMMIQV